MEKITEFINNIKDRFSNPLVFSFITSWFVSNWEITIALLWHDNKQIENEGCKSIFEFVNGKINWLHSFWIPFCVAVLYTFLMPVIRVWVNVLYTRINKWNDKWNLKILAGGKISIDKYIAFRNDFDKRNKILEEIIEKESQYKIELEAEKSQRFVLKEDLEKVMSELKSEKEFISETENYGTLNGYWVCSYKSEGDKSINREEEILIENRRCFEINRFGERFHVFDITDFKQNIKEKSIFFIKERVKVGNIEGKKYYINKLIFQRDDLLVGKENGDTDISYRKIEKPKNIKEGRFDDAEVVFLNLKKEDKVESYMIICNQINEKEYIPQDNIFVKDFIAKGLVKKGNRVVNDHFYSYDLTELGEKVFEKAVVEKSRE